MSPWMIRARPELEMLSKVKLQRKLMNYVELCTCVVLRIRILQFPFFKKNLKDLRKSTKIIQS